MKPLLSALGAISILGLGLALVFAKVGQPDNIPASSESHLNVSKQNDIPSGSVPTSKDTVKGYILAWALTPVPTVEMRNIPAYPCAKLIDDAQSDKPPQYVHTFTWETNATDSEVKSFYQGALSKQGWGRLLYPTPNPWTGAARAEAGMTPLPTPLIPNKNDDPFYPLLYYWSDSRGPAPYKFKVAVGVDHFIGVKDQMYAEIIRVPDENKIPVPPNAEQIEVQNSQDGGGRFITYLTDTRPEETRAFYEKGLEYYGWWTIAPDEHSDVVEFSYDDKDIAAEAPGGVLAPEISGRAYITLDTSGKTKVRIEIVGLKAYADLQKSP